MEEKKTIPYQRECVRCGTSFKSSLSTKIYCTSECTSASVRERNKMRYRLKRDPVSPLYHSCAKCVQRIPVRKKYCDECREVVRSQKNREDRDKYARDSKAYFVTEQEPCGMSTPENIHYARPGLCHCLEHDFLVKNGYPHTCDPLMVEKVLASRGKTENTWCGCGNDYVLPGIELCSDCRDAMKGE